MKEIQKIKYDQFKYISILMGLTTISWVTILIMIILLFKF